MPPQRPRGTPLEIPSTRSTQVGPRHPSDEARSSSAEKRTIAERIVYSALEQVEQKDRRRPDPATLKRALENVPTRARSAFAPRGWYHLPSAVEVRPRRSTTLAIRWLTDFAKEKRREKTMADRLANEIIDASNGVGAAVKRREDMARWAESNKAFAHYRW